ncbi:MAG: hypothetical protein D8M58_00870 [Calditrichaeota bacterium]|nr:MAG: hypothetical protein DWQ03_06210 [Calditrichota bacterium]MBL1203919.1 hypothetical protein [Calditrichota bacterium]NOG43752.1 hypothetical protein [Calditrichota bacterium]
MLTMNPASRITVLLQLIAFHSLAVGLGLIIISSQYLELYGFKNYSSSFFQAQGGVFHIVMCIAYFMASKNLNSAIIIRFVISAKTVAVIFLFVYFLYAESIWIILLSAIADGLMALLIFIFYKQYLHFIGQTRE